jgi:hypothetical protein
MTVEMSRVVEDCARYWRRTGVPPPRVQEMRAELEAHLQEATAEGKALDAVVGPHVEGFAEEWAREFRPSPAPPRRARAGGPALLAFVTAIVLLWVAAMSPVGSGSGAMVCCPRRVIESSHQVDPFSMTLALAILGAALLALTSALLLAMGRLTAGSITLGVATVLAAVPPITWVAALLLVVAFAWAQWDRRRALAAAK